MNKRELTVYSGGGRYGEPFPQIILQGRWLQNLGFSAGDKIRLDCGRDRIVIERSIEEK